MRLATWNVNSIRARVDRIVDFAVRESVDVLAMQEIKCKAEQFPYERFEEAGYHVQAHGFSQWNGVAIASREPLTDVEIAFPGMPGFDKEPGLLDAPLEARAIGATVGGVRVWSLYVPNGRALGDPHFDYKLDWLAALTEYTRGALAQDPDLRARARRRLQHRPDGCRQRRPRRRPGILDPRLAARAAGVRGLEAAGMTDVVRPLVPTGFTYWDYKRLRFPKNEGMRIDFILGSPAFADAVTGAEIHRNERKGELPSDHVPVVVDLDFATAEEEDLDRPMFW